MAVRLLLVLFVVVLGAFVHISLLNGQHIQFFYLGSRQIEVTVAELAILSFAIGAVMVLLDYGDFVVHVFLDSVRDFFKFDRLWGSAPEIPIPEER